MKTPPEQLYDVWFDRGPNPDYHDHVKKQLLYTWPVLYNAIEQLVTATYGELEPYNREALLDCLIDNKCDKLTARDLVAWGNTQYEKGQQSLTGV